MTPPSWRGFRALAPAWPMRRRRCFGRLGRWPPPIPPRPRWWRWPAGSTRWSARWGPERRRRGSRGEARRATGRMAPVTRAAELRTALHQTLRRVIVGQEAVLDGLLLALLVGGHVLLEGVPGTAKTLMARALAAATEGRFRRIQFTPDLLPSDILGTSVWRAEAGVFEFREGPIFTDMLLADEINRAPAKTQAALLEAM